MCKEESHIQYVANDRNCHMLQLLKLIAIELTDKDLCSFSLAYRTFHDAVEGDQIVWRGRLLKFYDEPAKRRKDAYDWRGTYQARKRLLQRELRDIEFEAGNSEKEQEALECLQDLLLGLSTLGVITCFSIFAVSYHQIPATHWSTASFVAIPEC